MLVYPAGIELSASTLRRVSGNRHVLMCRDCSVPTEWPPAGGSCPTQDRPPRASAADVCCPSPDEWLFVLLRAVSSRTDLDDRSGGCVIGGNWCVGVGVGLGARLGRGAAVTGILAAGGTGIEVAHAERHRVSRRSDALVGASRRARNNRHHPSAPVADRDLHAPLTEFPRGDNEMMPWDVADPRSAGAGIGRAAGGVAAV